jgi:PKD repeat protein
MYPYFPSKNIFALDQKNGMFMLKTHLYQNAAPTVTASFGSPGVACASSAVTITNTTQGAGTYTWSFPGGSPASSTATNPVVSYSIAGTYTITLQASGTGTNSGTSTSTSTIVVKQVSGALSFTNASCSSCSDGIASVNPSGGTSPYTYTWIPSGGNAAIATNLSPGCYSVMITDANFCTTTKTLCVSFSTGLKTNINTGIVSIYPNPAKEEVSIESQEENFTARIFNGLGQQVQIVQSNTGKSTVDLSKYSKGVYIVEVQSSKNTTRRKLIKE